MLSDLTNASYYIEGWGVLGWGKENTLKVCIWTVWKKETNDAVSPCNIGRGVS